MSVKPDKTLGFMGAIFGGAGALFLVIALVLILNTRAFLATAERAPGVVIENVRHSGSKGSTFAPRVRFTAAGGREVVFVGGVSSSPPSHDVGERVTVVYPPGKPEDARIESFFQLYFAPFILGLLGSIFGAVGGGLVLVPRLGERRRERARSLGRPLEAKVVSIDLRSNIRVGGRHPWVLVAEHVDGALGQTLRFSSPYLWSDPARRHPVGSTITVYCIPDDPKTYAIEIGED
jgi:hypothetical protein